MDDSFENSNWEMFRRSGLLREEQKTAQVIPFPPPERPSTQPPAETDAVVERMRATGRPMTREVYLAMNYPEGLPEPWTAELESMVPSQFRAGGDAR